MIKRRLSKKNLAIPLLVSILLIVFFSKIIIAADSGLTNWGNPAAKPAENPTPAAPGTEKLTTDTKSLTDWGKDKGKNLLSSAWELVKWAGDVTGIKSALGFNNSFWYNFFVGLTAGLIIIIANKLVGFIKTLGMIIPLSSDWSKKEKAWQYIRLFGSERVTFALGHYLPIVMGVVYGLLIKIPILSMVLQTITLTILFPVSLEGFFLESLMLAVIVGFAPTIIKKYIEYRNQERLERAKAAAEFVVQRDKRIMEEAMKR